MAGIDNAPPVLMNLDTGVSIEIEPESENQTIWFLRVSPNREMLAFRRTTFDQPLSDDVLNSIVSDSIVVINSQGETLSSIPWKDSLYSMVWLDNERLAITKPGSLLIVNPFTGEQVELKSNFPGIYFVSVVLLTPYPWQRDAIVNSHPYIFGQNEPVGWENGGILLESSLRIAVYHGNIFEPDIVLDLQTDQITEYLSISGAGLRESKWSPDETNLVTVGNANANKSGIFRDDELYLINRSDWEITQVTDFREVFQRDLIIPYYNWSPDGKRIAFWLDTIRDEIPAEFAIYDLELKDSIFYCIQSDIFSRGFPVPVWSPVGEAVLVSTNKFYTEKSVSPKILLLDIKNGIAYQVAEDMVPVGWMVP